MGFKMNIKNILQHSVKKFFFNFFSPRFFPWGGLGRLMRFHRPLGAFLLMGPGVLGFFLALRIFLDTKNPQSLLSWEEKRFFFLAFFVLMAGLFWARSLGCAYNDYCDRDIDGKVPRTAQRFFPQEKISQHPIELCRKNTKKEELSLKSKGKDSIYWDLGLFYGLSFYIFSIFVMESIFKILNISPFMEKIFIVFFIAIIRIIFQNKGKQYSLFFGLLEFCEQKTYHIFLVLGVLFFLPLGLFLVFLMTFYTPSQWLFLCTLGALCIGGSAVYPLLKRSHSPWIPQLFLALLFPLSLFFGFFMAKGNIMCFQGFLSLFLLYVYSILWMIDFDTHYAYGDAVHDGPLGLVSLCLLTPNGAPHEKGLMWLYCRAQRLIILMFLGYFLHGYTGLPGFFFLLIFGSLMGTFYGFQWNFYRNNLWLFLLELLGPFCLVFPWSLLFS